MQFLNSIKDSLRSSFRSLFVEDELNELVVIDENTNSEQEIPLDVLFYKLEGKREAYSEVEKMFDELGEFYRTDEQLQKYSVYQQLAMLDVEAKLTEKLEQLKSELYGVN